MHKLKITAEKHGIRIFLDEFELESVTDYTVTYETNSTAELTIKLMVSNPNIFADDSSNYLSSNA